MSIKTYWQDFLSYFRLGVTNVNNELFQQDTRTNESIDKLQTVTTTIANDTEQEKLDDKTELDLSKGDDAMEELVIQIINNETDEAEATK